MKLIVSDADHQLLAEGVEWVQTHYDRINYYAHELKRERINELAEIISTPGGDLTSRDHLDIRTLAVALEGLVEDGLPLPEDALREMSERLEASYKAQRQAMPSMGSKP